MKKIAIIAPCLLPVPAANGGAVEELITCIINQNEQMVKYDIDLFTIYDTSYKNTSFSHTNIIPILKSVTCNFIDNVTDKCFRRIPSVSAKRLLDKAIVNAFINECQKGTDYYAVIVENQMSTAFELIKKCDYNRRFPIYFHMHNDVDEYRSPYYIRELSKAGVQFICVSKYIEGQVIKYSPNAKTHVLYNGVDFDQYDICHTSPGSSGTVNLLYCGRIIPGKGVLELVQAIAKIQSAGGTILNTDIHLDIIGFSDKPTSYEKSVYKAANAVSHVSCRMRVSTKEMARLYENYQIVIMPTIDEEPFGLVALETMAKAIPLITTNSGALPEVVGDGAIVVDKNDDFVSNLADAIVYLVNHPEVRHSLGTKACNLARTTLDFDIKGYYHRLMNILDTGNCNETISVIIPVFNVENFLTRCIDSVIKQTYPNLEIILVDDGSTDNSRKLCDEYQFLDARVIVIHQTNQGLSAARNAGLDIATGDYIFFLDSDDYLSHDAFEILLNHLHRTGADIACCGISKVYEDGNSVTFTSPEAGIFGEREALIHMMRTNDVCTVAWNKLYKASLWEEIRFPIKRMHEDEATIYKTFYNSSVVAYIPDLLYKYYQRDDSLMNAGIQPRYKDFLAAIDERIKYFSLEAEDLLVKHSYLTYLHYVKYAYKYVDEKSKMELRKAYKDHYSHGRVAIFGIKKRFALWIWNYIRY